jgi:hypothetical protein
MNGARAAAAPAPIGRYGRWSAWFLTRPFYWYTTAGKHERMVLGARQSQILSHITELATSMRRHPRDVVLPFFARVMQDACVARGIRPLLPRGALPL